jgi:surface protein
MYGTFEQATNFNQNIGNWDISEVTDMTTVFYNCTLSTSKYDAILNGWNAQVPKDGVHVHGGLSKYSSAGSAARAALIADHSWVFDGDGGAGNAFRWNYILGGGTLSGASTTSVDIIYTGLGGTTLSGIATTSVEV